MSKRSSSDEAGGRSSRSSRGYLAVAPSAASGAASAAAPSAGRRSRRSAREYSLGEEIANAVTHGIGACLAVGVLLFSALVYGISLLLEYLMSTLYHALAHEGAKRVFKVLDHSCIYLLIAGSYTPYCLVTLGAFGGVWLAAFVWATAVAGVACEAFWTFRPRWVSAVLYVLLGWSVAFFIPQLWELLPAPGFWLLAAGGISYTVGAVFYVLKKVPYMHSVFHVFVLAGSVLQFLSIILFVI